MATNRIETLDPALIRPGMYIHTFIVYSNSSNTEFTDGYFFKWGP